MPSLVLESPCKINLLLNILGRRPDGFHELETVMLPVPVCDTLNLERIESGIELTCNRPDLPVDGTNLVHRAAQAFLEAAQVKDGVRIHLEKRLPLAAGLGGGSANAAKTLLGLNRLFEGVLSADRLVELAARLGSDVPFFLQDRPALALGRGERVTPLEPFPLLSGCGLALVHPGFGVSTAWAYQALNAPAWSGSEQGRRAQELIEVLQGQDCSRLSACLFNSLEAPVLRKFLLLQVIREEMATLGALAVLMSGSGSTLFAIAENPNAAEQIASGIQERLGGTAWIATASL